MTTGGITSAVAYTVWPVALQYISFNTSSIYVCVMDRPSFVGQSPYFFSSFLFLQNKTRTFVHHSRSILVPHSFSLGHCHVMQLQPRTQVVVEAHPLGRPSLLRHRSGGLGRASLRIVLIGPAHRTAQEIKWIRKRMRDAQWECFTGRRSRRFDLTGKKGKKRRRKKRGFCLPCGGAFFFSCPVFYLRDARVERVLSPNSLRTRRTFF